ncbi:hypothetical protein [Halorussus marinus]|uniref:hypothetical protein n=1 Tax=Halorussus marinus TaxID=2505976 RepID=UPI00106ED948|nr:hypothetical protein [Halorussus marinus]
MRYSVYLVEHPGSQGGERQVTSQVDGTGLDFYESGVWLTRESGRNFFPYEQIRTIREHRDDGSESGDAASESDDEADGDDERTDGRGEDDESVRDDGAEEELVE